jgi:predicted DNA-binding protein YlxM (UPF0122 family)
MADSQERSPLSFDTLLQFQEVLTEVLPFLQRLFELGNVLAKEGVARECLEQKPQQELSSGPLQEIVKQLPGAYQGRGHREHLSRLDVDNIQGRKKATFLDVLERYESCKEIFTRKQLSAVYLYFGEELTEEQVAKKFGNTRSAVHGLLARAQKRFNAHQKKTRREMGEMLRKINET